MEENPSLVRAHTASEVYTIGYSDAAVRPMQMRTLATCAESFLPYLHPGMSVLDCGCGPGSLTIELAERVAPGEVVGIDLSGQALDQARALAEARRVGNVRFEVGNVYELPYPAVSFDAVFSHALVSHLSEPARALVEMRRVLKPGGVAAVIDNDPSTFVISPPDSAMARFIALFRVVQEHNGGNRLSARNLRAALLTAGFAEVEIHAAGEGFGTLERTRAFAANTAAVTRSKEFVEAVLSQGWATEVELDALPSALLQWGEQSDAFLGILKCGALGWAAD
jgi:SAM-dependent methyltransferase